MQRRRVDSRDPQELAQAQAAAAHRAKEALTALQRDAKAARMYAGSAGSESQSSRSRFQAAYLSSLRSALAALSPLHLEFTPDAVFLGEQIVLEATERRGDMVEVLFTEGLRAVAVEAGASDEELIAMGDLLVRNWADAKSTDDDLASAAWAADFASVWFEIVDAMVDRDAEDLSGESPLVRELAGLVAEINAEAERGGDADLARLRQDEFAVLLRLRDHVASDASTVAPNLQLDGSLSSVLAEEVAGVNDERDLESADVAGLLAELLQRAPDDSTAVPVAEALLNFLVHALTTGFESHRLLQRIAELLDAELHPQLPHRELLRDSGALLAQEPAHSRLLNWVKGTRPEEGTPLVFLLAMVLPGEDEVVAFANGLAPWALRVVADVWLLRSSSDPTVALDVPKRLLARPEPAAHRLGLSMCSRQPDPRLIEPVLAHAGSADAAVREGVLFALRNHRTPRIRELIQRAIDDSAEGVRVEALRYAVAYKDQDMHVPVERRLQALSADLSEAEVRAVVLASARLLGERTISTFTGFADGTRPSPHPAAARLALLGLKTVGTPAARGALNRIAHTVPGLATEAESILGSLR